MARYSDEFVREIKASDEKPPEFAARSLAELLHHLNDEPAEAWCERWRAAKGRRLNKIV